MGPITRAAICSRTFHLKSSEATNGIHFCVRGRPRKSTFWLISQADRVNVDFQESRSKTAIAQSQPAWFWQKGGGDGGGTDLLTQRAHRQDGPRRVSNVARFASEVDFRCLSGLVKAVIRHSGYQGRAIGNAYLIENLQDVGFDCSDTDVKRLGNFVVCRSEH